MKKRYKVSLGLLFLMLLLGCIFVVTISNSQNSNKITDNSECSKIPLNQLDSERSQGLIIKDKKLLVVKLNEEDNYSVPGGHVDYGESSVKALAREISEEVGIKADVSSFQFYKTECVPKGSKKQRIIFYLVNQYQGDVNLQKLGDKVRWVNYEFESKKKADTDVKLALYHLKQDGLIE